MNALYVIVIFFINATSGEYLFEIKGNKPMTLEECTKTLMERGPQAAVDNVAQVGVCMKDAVAHGHSDT